MQILDDFIVFKRLLDGVWRGEIRTLVEALFGRVVGSGIGRGIVRSGMRGKFLLIICNFLGLNRRRDGGWRRRLRILLGALWGGVEGSGIGRGILRRWVDWSIIVDPFQFLLFQQDGLIRVRVSSC